MAAGTADAAARLRDLVAVDGPVIDIAEAALACAQLDRGALDLGPYRAHLRQLAGEARAQAAGSPPAVLAAVLAADHRYRGDRETYDDLANADLARVIDRRRGLPVALSILWMHTARACGWRCAGLNTPGHFVIRLEARQESWIVDPFDRGTVLEPEALESLVGRVQGPRVRLQAEHLVTVDDRSVLLRLQNNIRLRLQQAGERQRALHVLERMLIVAPRALDLWRSASAINVELENYRAAIDCLDSAIALAGSADARQRIIAERARLAGRLN